MGCVAQRCVGRLGVAALPQEADVVGHVVPHFWCIRFQRLDGVGDQREFAIVNDHGLGRVLAGLDRFRENQRDRLSYETNTIGGEQRAIGLWCGTAVGTGEVDAAWDR